MLETCVHVLKKRIVACMDVIKTHTHNLFSFLNSLINRAFLALDHVLHTDMEWQKIISRTEQKSKNYILDMTFCEHHKSFKFHQLNIQKELDIYFGEARL